MSFGNLLQHVIVLLEGAEDDADDIRNLSIVMLMMSEILLMAMGMMLRMSEMFLMVMRLKVKSATLSLSSENFGFLFIVKLTIEKKMLKS